MPGVSVTWSGIPDLKSWFSDAERKIDMANRAALVALVALGEREAKGNFQGAHPRGAPHTGGAKPNIVTGNLRRSITSTSPLRYATNSYASTIWPNAAYARAVELGNPMRGSRAFPYFAPAIKTVRERANALLIAEWGKLL